MLLLTFARSAWAAVMDEKKNPLRNAEPMAAHMVMQVLAWMWSAIFAVMFSSYIVFGITASAHALIIAGAFVTYLVFRNAEKRVLTADL